MSIQRTATAPVLQNGHKRANEDDVSTTLQPPKKVAKSSESQRQNPYALARLLDEVLSTTVRHASVSVRKAHQEAHMSRLKRDFEAVDTDAFAQFKIVKEQKLAAIKVAEDEHRAQTLQCNENDALMKVMGKDLIAALGDYVRDACKAATREYAQEAKDLRRQIEELRRENSSVNEALSKARLEAKAQSNLTSMLDKEMTSSRRQAVKLREDLQTHIDTASRLQGESIRQFKELSARIETVAKQPSTTNSPQLLPNGTNAPAAATPPVPTPSPIFPIPYPSQTSAGQGTYGQHRTGSGPSQAPHSQWQQAVADLHIKYNGLVTTVLCIQQQYDNLTTEHVVKQMVDQLQFMYPDVKEAQRKLMSLAGRVAKLEDSGKAKFLESQQGDAIADAAEERKRLQDDLKSTQASLSKLEAELKSAQVKGKALCEKSKDEVDQRLKDFLQFAGKVEARLTALEFILSKPKNEDAQPA